MGKRRFSLGSFLFVLFAFPLSYFTVGRYVNFDTASAVVFMIIMLFLIIRHRKKLDYQVMLKVFNIPLIYAVLWKTKFGLKFMDTVAEKYRELVKLIGYCFIGFGFAGLLFISANILYMLFNLFVTPKETSEGVALVLPLTNIPGIGYLSFWHFLITIFVTVLIHEFAHGIVARAHKVPVKSSGLGVFSLFLPVFPLAFVEPDEKKMQKDSDIVQYSIFAAGPMINIVFAILVALFFSFVLTPIENNITHPVGFSFTDVMHDFPAQQAGMSAGMVITSVNGAEVLDYQSFSTEIGDLKPDQSISFTTMNGSSYTLTTKASPDDPEKGYIGILGIQNERRINEEYSSVGGAFFWLKGLLRWFYFINLAIGLMNLLPLMITDGGRMLKVALEKIMGKGAKADKVWIFIGLLFIFTLLCALAIRYGLGLLSALGLG